MPPSLRLAASVDLGRHAAQIQFIERRLHEGYRSRSRSLAQLNRRLRPKGPPIETIIDGMLAEGRTPSVLEIGFGWGRVLIELAERFRSRPVSLRGINRESRPPVERSSDLAAVAKALGLVPPGEIVDLPLPALDFYDATALRLADESVDFVYSAVTIRFVEDKARLIEEGADRRSSTCRCPHWTSTTQRRGGSPTSPWTSCTRPSPSASSRTRPA